MPSPPEGDAGCGGLLCAAGKGCAEEIKDGAVVSAAAAVPRNLRRFIVVWRVLSRVFVNVTEK